MVGRARVGLQPEATARGRRCGVNLEPQKPDFLAASLRVHVPASVSPAEAEALTPSGRRPW